MPAIEISSDVKSGLGLRGAGIVEDFLVRIQWFASPVSRDFREETMLYGIPLRSTGAHQGRRYRRSRASSLRLPQLPAFAGFFAGEAEV